MKLFSRRDAALLLSLLLLSCALFLVLILLRGGGSGEWDVVISYRGETVARLPLETDTEYLFECEEGVNRIVVRDGAVRVESADCKNQVCVHHGALLPEEAAVDFISCAPHRLLITVERRDGK
ncbi:MAG: NusG domain II-containing protein [Clostridia bacterium]|nr:NusG domain II-containing protein [Clostridia bacterium]